MLETFCTQMEDFVEQKKEEDRLYHRSSCKIEAIDNVYDLATWLEETSPMKYDADNLHKELQILKDTYLLRSNKE